MYYFIDCDEPLSANGEALMEIHNTFRVGSIRLWSSGKRHDKPITTPIEIPFDTFRGYTGAPMEFLDLGIPIMSQRMADALREAGVRNIDFYDAVLINSQTGERYEYKAFNIIGLMPLQELQPSTIQDTYSGPKELNVQSSLPPQVPLLHEGEFLRIAEYVKTIVVSERIRDFLLSKGLNTLKFISPENGMLI